MTIVRASCLFYRGVSDQHLGHEAGSGGRGMTWCRRCEHHGPAVQAASSWRTSRAPRGPATAGTAAGRWFAGPDLGLKRWIGASRARERLKGQSTGGDTEQTSNTARGTPWVLADLRLGFDKPRYREVSRPVGPSGPWRPARPRLAEGPGVLTTAYPGPQRMRAMTHV